MAYAGSKKFQYQQLQYCPQRNVSSISKSKMFNSTVSKYDPRTGRTVLLQHCHTQSPAVIFTVNNPSVGAGYIPFTINLTGSGYIDFGDGKLIGFSLSQNSITGLVKTLKNITIYSGDLSFIQCMNQYIAYVNIVSAPNLTFFDVRNNNIPYVYGLNNSPKVTFVYVDYNLISQSSAEGMATDLLHNTPYNPGKYPPGAFFVMYQTGKTINVTTLPFTRLTQYSTDED